MLDLLKKIHFTKQLAAWFLMSLIVFTLDWWSKLWISTNLEYHVPFVFTSFFNFTLTYNPGAAFSFLSDAGGWQRWFFTIVASFLSVVIVVWMATLSVKKWRELLALSFILGGAVGNLYDRVSFGHVIDFIVVHYQGYYFPAFNLADSAIFFGACVWLLESFLSDKAKTHE